MAPSKLRQVVGAVKDQTSIGLAKVGASGGGWAAPELDVAIVKATRHGESFPAEERHVREVLALYRGGAAACVSALSRRLGRTRSWAVALKTLAIVHRLLLLDVADAAAVERELLCATRRGTRVLNLADFCDRSRADAWDFSAFVRTYAAYLDDRLEYRVQARQGAAARGARPLREEMYTSPGRRSPYYDDDLADADGNDKAAAVVARDQPSPVGEMTPEQLLAKAGQLQHLLGRFIACRPIATNACSPPATRNAGAAKSNRVVAVSLYPLVKESVQLYCELTEVMAALMEQFPEMETADCERVHQLFVGLAKGMDELQAFYAWCKDACVCRQSDVPEVEVVTHKKLELMDEFIRDRRAAESQPQRRLPQPSPEPAASPEPPPPIVEEKNTKALPAPDELVQAAMQDDDNQPEPEPLLIAAEPADEEADFLNLKADAMSREAHGHQMALALFNGNPSGTTTTTGDAFDPVVGGLGDGAGCSRRARSRPSAPSSGAGST
ncbi:hypothetical protein PR202_ga04727 [Eleusine coracana subsp. coracana]|uniref:ENTH domain-containing protein n=1 Tax=Eleusine coracana subsp. coracana TaxID=191504 RepID=A0AAV5BRZ1_ELECO|nr:hypothetical protein PR202_ga04727 [Eleusine coracana subsp. coracana]